MQELRDLIFIVNKRKLSQIELFDKTLISGKDTLFTKLYNGIADGTYASDDEAAGDIYEADMQDVRYRKLKSRFKKRLLNTLYFLDLNDTTKISLSERQYFNCLSKLYLSHIIQKYGGLRRTALQITQEAYTIGEKYAFYDIIKEFSYQHLAYYSLSGDQKNFRKELEKYKKYNAAFQSERESFLIYYQATMFFSDKESITPEMLQEVKQFITQLEKLNKSNNSLTIFSNYTLVQLLYYQHTIELNRIVEIADHFIQNIDKYPENNYRNTYENSVYIYKMKAYLDLRQYDDAHHLCLEVKKKIEGTNWFVMMEFDIKMALNSFRIDLAKEIEAEVRQHPQFKLLMPNLKERWKIYFAYTAFMQDYLNSGTYKFSVAKLFNEIPVIFQDKAGFNLSTRILEVLFLIGKNDLVGVLSKIDSLKVYLNRYLNDNSYQRSKLFLKLIVQLEKKNFNYKELNSAKEYLSLKNEFQHQINHESEVIAYDKLWEIILHILETNDKKLLK